jgi:hypothetical protein
MSSEMVRWGGLAGVGAGLMFLLSVILTLIAPPQMVVGYLSYYLIEVVLVAAFALTLVTIAGLHALQRGRYGRLGAAGFLLTFVGYALVLVSAHLITVVGGEPVSFVRFMGGLVMVVGSILLGVMTLYARVLPWWVGVLLIVSFPLDDILVLGVLSESVVFAVVWGSTGYALTTRRGTVAERPSRVSRTAHTPEAPSRHAGSPAAEVQASIACASYARRTRSPRHRSPGLPRRRAARSDHPTPLRSRSSIRP